MPTTRPPNSFFHLVYDIVYVSIVLCGDRNWKTFSKYVRVDVIVVHNLRTNLVAIFIFDLRSERSTIEIIKITTPVRGMESS